MPRSLSRTPHVTRARRTATPVRSRRILESPSSCQSAHAFASPAGTISQITPPERTPSTQMDTPSVSNLAAAETCCALCQLAISDRMPSNATPPADTPWPWPCACGVQLHLGCAVQLRLRSRMPPCLHCRAPWPGASADEALTTACQRAGLPAQQAWEPLPINDDEQPDFCAGMPPAPHGVLVLCCSRMSVYDAPVHAREAEWAPVRQFQTNAQGNRVHVGWRGEWSCNLCGRCLAQDDPMANPSSEDNPDTVLCPIDGPRTLVVDLAHNSRTWLCFPACTCDHMGSHQQANSIAQCDDAERHPANVSALFNAPPPASNMESTNSFVYCPILLHVCDLLSAQAAEGWCAAVPWFQALCTMLSRQLCDINHLAQAYAELLEISGGGDHAERRAVDQLRQLVSQYPAGTRCGIRCIIPAVIDSNGHVPSLLQDVMLQMYAGFQLASDIDRAVTAFRSQGCWPDSLQHLLASHEAGCTTAGQDADVLAATCEQHDVAHPADRVNCNPSIPTHLHQHPCVRRISANCGTRRRCRICNEQIPHRTAYYHCAQNCRFTACAQCFCPHAHRPNGSDGETRSASEPPAFANRPAHHTAANCDNAYGRVQLTRFVDMPRDVFVARVNGLIASGRFSELGIPQLRIEGTTAWGAWLRINRAHGAFGRRPQLLCGV